MPRQRLTFHANPTVVVVALVVTTVDAATKAWARNALFDNPYHLGGAVWLRLQYNSGISFSVNNAAPLITTVVTAIISLVVLVVGLNASPGISSWGFGLLLGGGVANLVDRLAASPHQVTDFIALGSFPVFNLADVAVTAGFIVLIVAALQGVKLLQR